MKKKKKLKKRKFETGPVLTAQDQEMLKTLLEDLKQINHENLRDKISGPSFAQALVEKLPINAPETPDLLLIIRSVYSQKNVQKAIKKVIFRLKQEGIQLNGLESPNTFQSPFRNIEKEDPTAYISPIDGTWSRGVLVILPQIPKGVDVGIGAVSYENGIINFITNRSSKKQVREIKDFFFKQAPKSVETSLSHASTILEKAYKKSQALSDEGVEDFLEIRPKILNTATLLEHSPIYDLISPDKLSIQSLTDSMIHKLLDHDLMESWIIPPEKIRPLLEEIADAENSPILVTEDQKWRRINEIKEKAVNDIYPNPLRLDLKDMLEEMSYIFYRHNEEENANLALLAALSLGKEESLIKTDPFLLSLLERSLQFYKDMSGHGNEAEADGDDSQSNLIIT